MPPAGFEPTISAGVRSQTARPLAAAYVFIVELIVNSGLVVLVWNHFVFPISAAVKLDLTRGLIHLYSYGAYRDN